MADLYSVSRQPEEAEQEARDMLALYEEFATQVAAIPVVAGRKSPAESFAGAVSTYTIEAMMSDCRALQVGCGYECCSVLCCPCCTRPSEGPFHLGYGCIR